MLYIVAMSLKCPVRVRFRGMFVLVSWVHEYCNDNSSVEEIKPQKKSNKTALIKC